MQFFVKFEQLLKHERLEINATNFYYAMSKIKIYKKKGKTNESESKYNATSK